MKLFKIKLIVVFCFIIPVNTKSQTAKDTVYYLYNYYFQLNGKILNEDKKVRTGKSYDTDGKQKSIIWLNFESKRETNVTVIF